MSAERRSHEPACPGSEYKDERHDWRQCDLPDWIARRVSFCANCKTWMVEHTGRKPASELRHAKKVAFVHEDSLTWTIPG